MLYTDFWQDLVFLIKKLGLDIFGIRSIEEKKCHFHHIMQKIYYQYDLSVHINLVHLAKTAFARFLQH